jgi:hypothetical protein
MFYNLNGVFFRISHLFKEIREWDDDHEDRDHDEDDERDDDSSDRKL